MNHGPCSAISDQARGSAWCGEGGRWSLGTVLPGACSTPGGGWLATACATAVFSPWCSSACAHRLHQYKVVRCQPHKLVMMFARKQADHDAAQCWW